MIDRISGPAARPVVINSNGRTAAKIARDVNPSVILGQLVLPLRPESARHARGFMAASLEAWFENRAKGLVHDSQTVLTELVANAVRHASAIPESTCHIWTYRNRRDGLRVEVHDPSEKMPDRIQAGPADQSGRGVFLSHAIVAGRGGELGWYPAMYGKCVYFTLPWRPY